MMRARRSFLKTLGRGTFGLGAAPLLGGVPDGGAAWPPPDGTEDAPFWEMVRAQYPVTRERVYFNTGGLGPAPYPVLDVVQTMTMELQRRSEHGHQVIEEARAPVAAFLGAAPAEVAFMRNATEGNATVASGLDLRRGDEVIFETHAHPGGAIPWMNRQRRDGIRVRVFEPDPERAEGNLERIATLITPRTRVIQVSHVTAPTGIRLPVEAIARLARDRGLWFHIDGAQSAGMFPFDLHAIGCDSYATSGHKWMGAPHGTGVLYVREDRLDEVTPTEVGAYSEIRDGGYVIPDVLAYHPTARRYEPGTRNAPLVAGTVAAVRFLEQVGMERVERRGRALASLLQDGLRTIPGVTILTPSDPALSGAITTFKSDRVPYDRLFAVLLDEYDMRCRVVTERGLDALRVSTHLFNAEAEVRRLVEATRTLVEGAG